MVEATSLADLVEHQANHRPGGLAVVSAQGSFTYAELDSRASRLAHRLQALGVGPEAVVGVCIPRTLDMAVAILAVLKAGGAVLPLDPSYPVERLAFMLDDAAAPVVVTAGGGGERLGSHGGHTVRLDADWPQIAALPGEAPPRAVGPHSLAYVVYTSGSTGEPKGVMLTHGGLMWHNRAIAGLFELVPSDRVLQFCSIGFDVSIEEILPTWASGATVVLRPDDLPTLGRQWWRWVTDQRITVLNLPTAYWQEWGRDLHAEGRRVPGDVRLVAVGGEKVPGPAYLRWMAVGGDRARWLNAYGPAEASVTATAYEPPEPGGIPPGRDPPIGRPVGGATVHILDEAGQPVPDGEAGEIHVGGPGVARGYLRRPELTAERFVPDPFSSRPGARLYRTGDVGRYLPSGDVEFLGRLDHQVKVRGFRIETGEVEAALLRHAAVSEAAVVARQDARGDTRLVAYVVAGAENRPSPAELRRVLCERLPSFMVPSEFVGLDSLPRTPNGKIDRAALPAPRRARGEPGAPLVAPRTAIEKELLGIWSRVLGIEGIGVLDDFFELGGHSLLATQVIAHVREAFTRDVPLSAMFEHPTIAGLAGSIADGDERERVPPLVAVPRVAGDRLPLSLAQEQMLNLELRADPPGLYNVTAIHRFSGPVDTSALRCALDYMVQRHETLRSAFPVEGGTGYQVVATTAPAELMLADLGALEPEERETELRRLITAQDAAPFDLTTAPLFRSQLVRLDATDSRLVVTFDHLICDMTSTYIFLSELATAYDALAGGREPELAPLPLQYGDFALWQRRWLNEERLAAQYDYWRTTLSGMPMGPAVPFDHLPGEPGRRIGSLPLTVPPAVYSGLEGLARQTAATPFIVTVAALDAVLAAHGGLDDIVLSTTLSGRQRNECEGLIGMFAGMGRMRTDVSGDPSFAELVGRARQTVLGLFEHQDIPFMKVRKALFPDFPEKGDYARTVTLIPIELLYFHAGHQHWAPGSGVVERPTEGPAVDEMFFRGQLQPLSFTFFDDGRRMWGQVSYKADFYEAATVERLVADVESVFREVAENPRLRVSELPLTLRGPDG